MGKRREFLKGRAAKLTTWDVASLKHLMSATLKLDLIEIKLI